MAGVAGHCIRTGNSAVPFLFNLEFLTMANPKNDSYIYVKKDAPIKGVQSTKKIREQGMDDNFQQVYTIGVKQKSNIPADSAVLYDEVAYSKGEMVRIVKNAKVIGEYLDNARDYIGVDNDVLTANIEGNVIGIVDRSTHVGEKVVRVKFGRTTMTMHRECVYSLSWEPDEAPRAEILNQAQVLALLPDWYKRFEELRPIVIVGGSKFANDVKFATKDGEGKFTVRKLVIGNNGVEYLTPYGSVKTEAEAKAQAERI